MAFIKGNDDIDTTTSNLDDTPMITNLPKKKLKVNPESSSLDKVKLELFQEAINCLRAPLRDLPAVDVQAQDPLPKENDEISLFLEVCQEDSLH